MDGRHSGMLLAGIVTMNKSASVRLRDPGQRLAGMTGGFTLAEIMLVVAILGILVGVVVPRLTGRTKEARTQATRLQIENLSMALDAFEYDCGRFPTPQEGLEALRQAPAGIRNWKGPYLKKAVPVDSWNNTFVYVVPGRRNPDYDLLSPGPDGQEGGDDDIGNW